MKTRHEGPPISPHLILGLAIMAWGLLLALDNFGLLEADRYWRLWPLVLVAIGVVRLLDSARTGGALCTFSGGLVTIVGLALLLHNLEIVSFKLLWPIIVFAVGGGIVWRGLGRRGRPARRDLGDWKTSDDKAEDGARPSQRLDAFTFMGGVHRKTSSQEFTGGTAMAVMGGCEIDLRFASLADGRATFDTFAMWGGVEIRVPEDWAVESHVVPLLGGFEDKTHPPAHPTQRLVVTGVAIMGGVAVKN